MADADDRRPGLTPAEHPPIDPIPRVALRREEAAAALSMSLDSFERYVQSELRLIRRGKLRLVPVSELRRWADDAAERTLP
jgi:hypothetical protein